MAHFPLRSIAVTGLWAGLRPSVENRADGLGATGLLVTAHYEQTLTLAVG
jgi:hypothetical protein